MGISSCKSLFSGAMDSVVGRQRCICRRAVMMWSSSTICRDATSTMSSKPSRSRRSVRSVSDCGPGRSSPAAASNSTTFNVAEHYHRLLTLIADLRPDELDLRVAPAARRDARRAARALIGMGLAFHTLFCHWMIKFFNPGSGTHCGSSFPMRHHPSRPFDSDTLGRPFGWSRIFIVDSSVLPSTPGTTLAFTTMANADRIAASAPLHGREDR
jgi:hypothetical protein